MYTNTDFAKAESAYRAARLRRTADAARRRTRNPELDRSGEVVPLRAR